MKIESFALVVQRIGRKIADLVIVVRFHTRAQIIKTEVRSVFIIFFGIEPAASKTLIPSEDNA